MFNLLDADTGDKVDFWLLTDDPFDQSRFARKEVDDLLVVKVSRPEDTILMKLKWSRESGGSTKQLADARHVYETQLPTLDQSYLDRWAAELDVVDGLAGIRAAAKDL